MEQYPKILLITAFNIFEDNSSSSFTIRSFIEDWPKENVAQLICGDFNEIRRELPNSFSLWHKDILFANFIPGNRQAGPVIKDQPSSVSRKQKLQFKSIFRNFAIETYSLFPYKYTKALESFIIDFNPDFVYTIVDDIRDYRLAVKISQRFNIPFYPHIVDDWPNIKYTKSPLSIIYKFWFRLWIKKVIKNSRKVFCISELMCKEYEKRYHCSKFIPLMHSIEIVSESKELKSIHNLIYTGSLYLGRYQTILSLCKIIERHNLQIQVSIYCKPEQWRDVGSHFTNIKNVQYGGFVSQSQISEELKKSDGLLFVESFDESLLDYTRLSLSTKVPEYLASGIPVFAAGNENQGSIQYLIENGAAYVAKDHLSLESMFLDFIQLKDHERICSKAQEIAKQNHLKSVQKDKFLNTILSSL